MKWQIIDAEGTIRFATETHPVSRDEAEALIASYDNDPEAMREFPQWFPMWLKGVPDESEPEGGE